MFAHECVIVRGHLVVEVVAAPVGGAVVGQGDSTRNCVQASLHQITEHSQLSACQLTASKEEITGERGTAVSMQTPRLVLLTLKV